MFQYENVYTRKFYIYVSVHVCMNEYTYVCTYVVVRFYFKISYV